MIILICIKKFHKSIYMSFLIENWSLWTTCLSPKCLLFRTGGSTQYIDFSVWHGYMYGVVFDSHQAGRPSDF